MKEINFSQTGKPARRIHFVEADGDIHRLNKGALIRSGYFYVGATEDATPTVTLFWPRAITSWSCTTTCRR